jgi:MoxR-like ATPase
VADASRIDNRAAVLERDKELAAIADALLASSGGAGGRTLLIEGPAGIGKTTLLLTNTYRKLGDCTREDLAAVIGAVV